MGKFKVQKSSAGPGIIPEGVKIPSDCYYFDLVFIEEIKKGQRNLKADALSWSFRFSDIPEQKKKKIAGQEFDLSKFVIGALTPTVPTPKNKFGAFLAALWDGKVEENMEGDTFDLIKGKYRVKGFLEITEKGDNVYHNVTKLVDGSVKKGGGCGIKGIAPWMLDNVNDILDDNGLPTLDKEDLLYTLNNDEDNDSDEEEVEEKPKAKAKPLEEDEVAEEPKKKTKKRDIEW
jgi:hypothetical protein